MSQDEFKISNGAPSTGPVSNGNAEEALNSEKVESVQESETFKISQQLTDLKDKYVRAVAEMENMRRRMERERADLVKFALEHILKDMLPTLDSLEKALPDSGSTEHKVNQEADSGYYAGMIMVKKQLLEVLRKHGLEAIRAKGEVFDPNLHQAIQRVESKDVDTDLVGDEYARGYTLHGRLLRPAMVSVLSPAGS